MLILKKLLHLKFKQGNFTPAFHHVDLGKGENVYVQMPLRFWKSGKVLKLNKIFIDFVNVLALFIPI